MLDCVNCGAATRVVDCRESAYGFRRRRECKQCRHRFSTLEILYDDADDIRSVVRWAAEEVTAKLPPPKE